MFAFGVGTVSLFFLLLMDWARSLRNQTAPPRFLNSFLRLLVTRTAICMLEPVISEGGLGIHELYTVIQFDNKGKSLYHHNHCV